MLALLSISQTTWRSAAIVIGIAGRGKYLRITEGSAYERNISNCSGRTNWLVGR